MSSSASSMNITWHVLGAGSIGCLFAACLQRAGVSTHVILRDAMRLRQWRAAGGITLHDGPHAQRIAPDASCADDPHAPGAPIRQLLVCTKAQQTRAALAAIEHALAPDATLVLLQNGMGVREQIQPLLPRAAILHALSTEGAYQTERFHVVHAGHGETLIGASDPTQRTLARATATALRCELRIDAVDDIDARLWLKLAVNSIINPLTALHDCRNGDVPTLPGSDEALPALCREAAAVATAAGQPLTAERIAAELQRVCHATAANRSSMLQDIAARRRTEIDFINGHVVRVAAAHGIDCPRQQALLQRVRQLEERLDCR